MKVHFLTHKQLNSEELQAKLLKDLQVAVGSNPIIRVHFEDPEFNPIHAEEKGDWIDLCAGETVSIDGGQSKLISLGVAMKLPNGFEAHLLPRSSTFNKYGILMANSMGIVDNSYSGTEDYWKFNAYATHDVTIHKGDRIAQFRIMPTMAGMYMNRYNPMFMEDPHLFFVIEDSLDTINRGGFGSTGN